MKCKDCKCCHEVVRKRWRNDDWETVRIYECWGVREPFEIKDIEGECTEYPEKNNQVNISFAKCCGNCVHTSKPKKPDTHAAHYDVAKTERWCYLHNIYITRETVCDDFSWETKKGGVPACKRVFKFNEKLLLLRELQSKLKNLNLLNTEIKVADRVFVVREGVNYIEYGYSDGRLWGRYSCKDRDMMTIVKNLITVVEEYEVME